ncbi:serine/threonine-protein kinase [Streptomyces sp. SJL17-1]|uniref:serine/threonine-protein kinase n=1 Tax=Streptomyces sp. SJL17-1 TaxID=2967223 RepID=UPI0029663B36|nr:serine/threonine-protein kinase [Streptomyces sp. SJL17-1]
MRPLGPTDPRTAGPYGLLAELGRGGMGRVFLGAAPDGRLAAVKQVHARLAADEDFRARFRREVAASRRVSGACTAAVMDADTEAATPWLASVFVAGPSLGAAVERSGTLPVETVRRLAVQLATALDEIHRAGLIHRDLKPENVLLAEDGARVIDFGIARAAEAGAGAGAGHVTELTGTGLVVGSPAFMSPEQAEGKELTPASDVFSLGSVLTLASTGASPFAGPSTFQALYNVVHTEPDLTAVPAGLRPLVTWCLAKDPAARPTPAQLLASLGPAAPVARQWPPAVHAAIAEQRRDIDRLLVGGGGAGGSDDHKRTVVLPPGGGAAAPTAVATRLDAAPVRPRRAGRRGRTGRFVAAGVALAVLGAGAWWYFGDGGPGEGPPDLYVTMPVCSEVASKLPVPGERRPDQDQYLDYSDNAETSCSWNDKDEPQSDGWNYHAHAMVRWELRRSAGASENGTRRQEAEFADDAEGERPEKGLDFADEAFWSAPSSAETTCSLYVRRGNLVVYVSLGGKRHQAETCEGEAKKISAAAVSAMPNAS